MVVCLTVLRANEANQMLFSFRRDCALVSERVQELFDFFDVFSSLLFLCRVSFSMGLAFLVNGTGRAAWGLCCFDREVH